MQRLLDLFIFTDALHVLGGFYAHNQEHKTVHKALGIVKSILLPAALVDEMELFICPCIVIRLQITANKMQSLLNLFIFTDALHNSGGASAHHQEYKTVYIASGIVKSILLPAAIVDEMERKFHLIHDIIRQQY
jgi:hypothetical protein